MIKVSLNSRIRRGIDTQTKRVIKQTHDAIASSVDLGELLDSTMDSIAKAVISRTQKGIDFQGGPLKKYTPSYLAAKKRAGRYSGKVDLTFYNDMLGATSKRRKTASGATWRGEVFIAAQSQTYPRPRTNTRNTQQLAKIHHRGSPAGKVPKRPFFAWRIGTPEDKLLRRIVNQRMIQNVKRRANASSSIRWARAKFSAAQPRPSTARSVANIRGG